MKDIAETGDEPEMERKAAAPQAGREEPEIEPEDEEYDEDRALLDDLPEGYSFKVESGWLTGAAIGSLRKDDAEIRRFSHWEASDIHAAAWEHHEAQPEVDLERDDLEAEAWGRRIGERLDRARGRDDDHVPYI
jgi:hypothetical protein